MLHTFAKPASRGLFAQKDGACPASTRLTITDPRGTAEQEADLVAGQITHMPDARQGHRPLQVGRSPVSEAGAGVAPPAVDDVLRLPGQPLDAASTAFFGRRFGHDFSQIRVHSDARAAESAREINARAYTAGRDIVFGTGQYAPTTTAGRELLAHELTHVIQQRALDAPATPRSAARKIQRSLDDFSVSDCDVDASMEIGIFAKPTLYKEPGGLSGPADLAPLAQRWQTAINDLWTGPVPCRDSTERCNFTMHATVQAYPEATARVQVPARNSVRVRETGFRSNAFGVWGAWAHDDDDKTIAHETGHLLGLADKYFYTGAMKSYPRFVNDIMADYPRDAGPTQFGPARARVMAFEGVSCPCCTKGMQRRP